MNEMIGMYIQVNKNVLTVHQETQEPLAGLVGYIVDVDNEIGVLIVTFPAIGTQWLPIALHEINRNFPVNQDELFLAYNAAKTPQQSKPEDDFDLLYRIIQEKREMIKNRLMGYRGGSLAWKQAKAAQNVLMDVLAVYADRNNPTE